MKTLLIALALAPISASAATFAVDTYDPFDDRSDAFPGDGRCGDMFSDECTLRAAIEEANALPGPDIITFSDDLLLEHPDILFVELDVPLQPILDDLIIDGTTHPLFQPASMNGEDVDEGFVPILLFGDGIDDAGLHILSGDVTIRGIAIGGFDSAIVTEGDATVTIDSCHLGRNGRNYPRNETGIEVASDSTATVIIGGDDVASGNLIAGNFGANVLVEGAGSLTLGYNRIGRSGADLGDAAPIYMSAQASPQTVTLSHNRITHSDRTSTTLVAAGSTTLVDNSFTQIAAGTSPPSTAHPAVVVSASSDAATLSAQGNVFVSGSFPGLSVTGPLSATMDSNSYIVNTTDTPAIIGQITSWSSSGTQFFGQAGFGISADTLLVESVGEDLAEQHMLGGRTLTLDDITVVAPLTVALQSGGDAAVTVNTGQSGLRIQGITNEATVSGSDIGGTLTVDLSGNLIVETSTIAGETTADVQGGTIEWSSSTPSGDVSLHAAAGVALSGSTITDTDLTLQADAGPIDVVTSTIDGSEVLSLLGPGVHTVTDNTVSNVTHIDAHGGEAENWSGNEVSAVSEWTLSAANLDIAGNTVEASTDLDWTASATATLSNTTFDDIAMLTGTAADWAIDSSTWADVGQISLTATNDLLVEQAVVMDCQSVHLSAVNELRFVDSHVSGHAGPRLSGLAITLENTLFEGLFSAILVEVTGLATVFNNQVVDAAGLSISGPGDATVRDNHLLRNAEDDAGLTDAALDIRISGTATVTGNTIERSVTTGMWVDAEQTELRGNTIADSGGAGMVVDAGAGSTLLANIITGGLREGMRLSLSDSTVGGAGAITDNALQGIAVVSADALLIQDLSVRSNGTGITLLDGVDIQGVTFGDNRGLAIDTGGDGLNIEHTDNLTPCLGTDAESVPFLPAPQLATAERTASGDVVVSATTCPGASADLFAAEAGQGDVRQGQGYGEGIAWLSTATADDSGAVTWTVPVQQVGDIGPLNVTALARNGQTTSEFSANVPVPSCGDGVLDTFEGCDDGNTIGDDGCSSQCILEPGYLCDDDECVALCGDGVVAIGTETCDDANDLPGDGCWLCQVEDGFVCMHVAPVAPESVCDGICGDERIFGTETCDDGNGIVDDGCSDCQWVPDTVFAAVPDPVTSERRALFQFEDRTGHAIGFECSDNDGESWLACDDGELIVEELTTGTYAVQVRGLGPTGVPEPSPAQWVWEVVDDADEDGTDWPIDNCLGLSNPSQSDIDEDGLGDPCDEDMDGDGLLNAWEDLNGDGIVGLRETDPHSPDTDGDGLCDGWVLDEHIAAGVICVLGEDENLDGSTDNGETDPTRADTDGDCLSDGEEVLELGTDPLQPNDDIECVDESEGCGCSVGPQPSIAWLALAALAALRRRQPRPNARL